LLKGKQFVQRRIVDDDVVHLVFDVFDVVCKRADGRFATGFHLPCSVAMSCVL
jgi:hypothetical protein